MSRPSQPTIGARLLELVTAWFQERPGVAAIALVGSHARGTARPDSRRQHGTARSVLGEARAT